jgi:Flp pilus assembly CpaF family ATPase
MEYRQEAWSTGEIKLRRLVKQALRMRPLRIMGRGDRGWEFGYGPLPSR